MPLYNPPSVGVVPVKATGVEVNTGTNDDKFATPKAIEDSDYVKSAAVVLASALDTDVALTANSDAKVATQKATKAYVDANAGGGGVTNSAGENVIPKADAEGNLVASIITEDPSGDFIAVAGTPLYARTLDDGELLIGATGTAPIAAPLAALSGGSLQVVNGPGTIEIGLAPLSEGDQRFIFSDVEGHLSVSSSPANVDGAILIGGSTGEPTATTLTEGEGVVVTNGPGTIALSVSGVLPAPTSAPILANAQLAFYLDQVTHKMMIAVKYSDGTTKTGEVALT